MLPWITLQIVEFSIVMSMVNGALVSAITDHGSIAAVPLVDPASIFERKPPGKDTEFGEYLPSVKPEIHQTTWCTDEAIRFVTENRDRPWLISVNVLDPHSPFDPPEEYRRRYDVDDLPDPHFQEGDLEIQARLEGVDFSHKASPPEAFDAKGKMAAYYAMVELIDYNVGRLLDHLERQGLIVVREDFGGERTVTVAGLETA